MSTTALVMTHLRRSSLLIRLTVFSEIIKEEFRKLFDHYVQVCKDNMKKDGQVMEVCVRMRGSRDDWRRCLQDPFGDQRGPFQYGSLLERLNVLRSPKETS